MTEEWKAVPDFEGYQVSSEGLVIGQKGAVLSPERDARGRAYYHLFKDGYGKRIRRSRLVLLAFHPIENADLFEAAHLNNDPSDDRLCNLTWATRLENIKHQWVLHETKQHGAQLPWTKLTEIQVKEIYVEYRTKRTPYRQIAARYGINDSSVMNIVRHKTWRHLRLWEMGLPLAKVSSEASDD